MNKLCCVNAFLDEDNNKEGSEGQNNIPFFGIWFFLRFHEFHISFEISVIFVRNNLQHVLYVFVSSYYLWL